MRLNFITSYCEINNRHCMVNGQVLLRAEGAGSWPKALYKQFRLSYPKFHKMDLMSRIGILGTVALQSCNQKITQYNDEDVALVFANKNSSAHTDLEFRRSYKEDGSPSPSLFVYTLPNILMGEIAIKNKWYGENVFVIAGQFDARFFEDYCAMLIPQKAKACICGWVNVADREIDAFLFAVEQEDHSGLRTPLTANNLSKLRVSSFAR